MAHDQLRPLPFLLQPVSLAKSLISGRDIEVMSRHLLFSVPSVFMSRPQFDAATSFAFHFFSLGCDLSSTLQLISFLPTIFQVATSN